MVRSTNKSFLLNQKLVYKVTGTLWIECEGERFFGPGRFELLQKNHETGSINKAAKQMGMSYKKAWEMFNALNRQATKPLVIIQTDGEKGGGSLITDKPQKLMAYHLKLRERFQALLREESKQLSSL